MGGSICVLPGGKPLMSCPGVYAWIGINFVLGRFDHEDGEWGSRQHPALWWLTCTVHREEAPTLPAVTRPCTQSVH